MNSSSPPPRANPPPIPPLKPRARKPVNSKSKTLLNTKFRSKQTKSLVFNSKALHPPVIPTMNYQHTFLSPISEDENQEDPIKTIQSNVEFNLNSSPFSNTSNEYMDKTDQINLSDFVKSPQPQKSWMTASWNLF